jgi:hypothetical protein
MEASMRLTTIGVKLLKHDGLAAGEGWSEFDYKAADRKARASFREHVGRFVKIHPDDQAELGDLGLALDGGRIVEVKAKDGKAR